MILLVIQDWLLVIIVMHIEEDFELLIKHLYNCKIAVAASPHAKKILEAKHLTPALFMRPFYEEVSKLNFSVIDIEDFRRPTMQEFQEKAESLLSGSLMNQKVSSKEHFDANTDIEDHINRQNFRWFLETCKLYLATTSYDYTNTTIDQPLAIIQILSAKDNYHKDYQSVNEETNRLKRESYILNPTQNLKLEPFVIILIDKDSEATIEEALKYTEYLRKDCKINGNLISRIDVNLPESGDMHSFWLPCVRTSYEYKQVLKPGHKIYLLSPMIFDKLKKETTDHQEQIVKSVGARMNYLYKQFKQFSKTTNKIKGLFSSNSNKDKYTNDEQECRQLADLYFLLGDYKKAYECYSEILGKFNDRNKRIYFSILEMTIHCIVFSKKYEQWYKNGEVYSTFEKESKAMLEGSPNFTKQAIFIIYGIYSLKRYRKEFIRDYLYLSIKSNQKDVNCPKIMNALIQEQIATFHLLYDPIEKRNYTNLLLKVGMLFSQNKLQLNAFHCFKIIQNTYSGSFSTTQRFIYTYLSKMCLENHQHASAVIYLRKGWNAINNHISEDKYTQFLKNYQKLLAGVVEAKAENYLKQDLLPLRFPIIRTMELSLEDELCDQKLSRMSIYNFNNPTSEEWTEMGVEYFGGDNLSMNANKEHFRKLAAFDAESIEKKQILHRVKVMVQNEQNIIKNTRTCFVNEEIKVQIYIYNPLFKQIELNDCRLVIVGTNPESGKEFIYSPEAIDTKIKPTSQKVIEFTIIPKQPGLYQLSKFTWYFNRLFNEFQLPKYKRKTERNYYFKFNVLPQVGKLRIHPKMDESVSFIGMVENVSVTFANEGKEPISDITLFVSDPRLFGFRRKDIDKTINPGESMLQVLPVRIYSSDLISIRCLIIYKSAGLIRIKRLIIPLATNTVVEIKDLACEKLSSHIHLLSFDVEKLQVDKLNQSINLLNDDYNEEFRLLQMILGHGFQIQKVQSTKAANKTCYKFFLQKNPHAPSQRNLFTNVEAQDPSLYQSFCQADEEYRKKKWEQYDNKSYPYDHHERMPILFIFEYQGKKGIIHPDRVSTNPKLLKILDKQSRIEDFLLPFDFKATYPAVISNNFQTNPVLEIDVEFKIKNIFTEKVMDLGVEFIDGDLKVSPNDQLFCGNWEGQVSYRVELQKDKEVVFKLKFVVFQYGIFDMSKIRYKLFKEKAKSPITIMHNQFQKLYVQVIADGASAKSESVPMAVSSDLLG